MDIHQWVGWILVLGATLLLVSLGNFDLLALLLPLSLLLAYGISCSRHQRTKLTDESKKG
jgi:hypothetical protein